LQLLISSLVEFQAFLKLVDGFIRCFDGFDAVPAKIVGRMLQTRLGPS
jgi:hypothetical protein